jgi:RNA-directed DNA polymerase
MKVKETIGEESSAALWQELNWEQAEESLKGYQRAIALAAKHNNNAAVVEAQKTLVRSMEAKALAVRHICASVSQPGIDGVRWITDADKMKAAFDLDSKDYKAKPMRMIVLRPKGQDKERHIQIPTFFDRAMQTLYAYSLDPVAESISDRKSFAFRRGRGQNDVHAYIMRALEKKNPPKYIVKADVKAYYASISHDWLMRNIPIDTKVLEAFLKAGHFFGGELFPADDYGISLGSSLSPILGNLTLDGLQTAIFDGLHGQRGNIDYADGDLIRFADDCLIFTRTRESADKIRTILSEFLGIRGLRLSEEKTQIIEIHDGFDFLSRNYRRVGGVIHTAPSEAAVKRMEEALCDLILPYRGGQKALIERLNKKLIGWASYHKVTEATDVFRHIDTAVKALLLQLCERLHPAQPRSRIITKYFYLEPNGEYIYALGNKPDVKVVQISDTVLVKHTPIATKKNPYLDDDYYEERTDEHSISAVVGKYKPVWVRQNGKCYHCGEQILTDHRKTLVIIDPTRAETAKNQAYVHEYCLTSRPEFLDTESYIDSDFDLMTLLEQMKTGTVRKKVANSVKHKFDPLAEHFRERNDAKFTLTFDDFSKIIGEPLCASAYKDKDYWRRRGTDRISKCWLSNGYCIKTLDLAGKRIVFARDENLGEALKVPDVFLKSRIPPNAKAELENHFEYIRKKYGI